MLWILLLRILGRRTQLARVLLATDLAEKVKEADHIKMVDQFGLGFLDFQKFGVAFESSGAFGKTALKVWDRLKYVAAEVGLNNYVVAGKPFTWSAFNFEQMIPQKVSWVIMRQNANAIIQGAQRSRNGNGVQCAISLIIVWLCLLSCLRLHHLYWSAPMLLADCFHV